MKIRTFRHIVEFKLKGDVDMPDNTDLQILFYEASVEIAMHAEPNTLTHDLDTVGITPLRVTDCAIIEMPGLVDFEDQTAALDFEETLCFAAAYYIVSYLSAEKRAGARKMADMHVAQHVALYDKCNEA